MRLEKIKIDKLIPYERNPRKNDGAVDYVVNSIEQCEYISPIIVDEDMVIIAGHTRYKAMQKLGWEEAEVLICDHLTDEQKKKYRFLDNKTGEKAVWDFLRLEEELQDLDLEGVDFFGLSEEDLEELPEVDYEQKISGGLEINAEEYSDEKFKYECPVCGFRFN